MGLLDNKVHMKGEVWKEGELNKLWLEGVRGAIPFAEEQILIIRRVCRSLKPDAESILDLGCGDGVLGSALLEIYPDARGVFLDFSQEMIRGARKRLSAITSRCTFLEVDYGDPSWVAGLGVSSSFDIIVSGFSIHHQTDERKKEIYQEIFSLLVDGGLFLNLEHVASSSPEVENLFKEAFVDSLYEFHKREKEPISREKVAEDYYNRPDKEANILAPVERQCAWLRDIGFADVDCFFKYFEFALFGGRK